MSCTTYLSFITWNNTASLFTDKKFINAKIWHILRFMFFSDHNFSAFFTYQQKALMMTEVLTIHSFSVGLHKFLFTDLGTLIDFCYSYNNLSFDDSFQSVSHWTLGPQEILLKFFGFIWYLSVQTKRFIYQPQSVAISCENAFQKHRPKNIRIRSSDAIISKSVTFE